MAISRKEEGLLTSREQLLLLFQPSHPRSPLGPAKPEAAWASVSAWSGAPQLVLAWRAAPSPQQGLSPGDQPAALWGAD